MLTAYLTQTRSLLQLPGTSSSNLYTDADLTRFINIARGQVAGEGECIWVHGAIPTVVGQDAYRFQDINVGSSGATGVQGVIKISSLHYAVGNGQLWLTPRPWPWFSLYERNTAVPQPGPPKAWAQYGQGAAPSGILGTQAGGGSFYVSPVPDNIYSLIANSVCYPVPLTDESTVEALPYFWTDAVPFFAAYFALLSAQTNARMADAAQMYKNHYKEFMSRAREQSNPNEMRYQYRQAGDPAQATKMGAKGASPQ